MRMNIPLGLLLLAVSPFCSAVVPCALLDPGSPQYRTQLGQVAKDAGLGNRLSATDEQVVASFCANHPERIDELIDQGRITAREASAVKKALVAGGPKDRISNGHPAVPDRPAPRKPSPEEAAQIDGAVDSLFIRWAQNWFTDRYVRGSAHVAEEVRSASGTIVRGQFSFTRGGALLTIPFASYLSQSGGAFMVDNLCYNDTTSNMTDCTASGASSAAGRLLGAVIVGGIIAGLDDTSDDSED